ncbi:adenylate/guanylate cyclase domain-containing protein [Thalassovita aquimarina]|uniref:AAA family ATPase n=1 Tax=Thalassovita aquimarina TaxID=2785917 RepID=A0ABS5HWA0_9RHOB|nr:adenylate/guanylate cyclase domain-containing protein [Thalassovita aquimarina]MBR9653275.1 AAA family ATPase [Thalassovita aquimarina]
MFSGLFGGPPKPRRGIGNLCFCTTLPRNRYFLYRQKHFRGYKCQNGDGMASTDAHENVASWLSALGLAEHAPSFEENGVDINLLAELTNEDLKDLGVTRLADRKRLLAAIAQLRDAPATPQSDPATHTDTNQLLHRERRQVTILFADLSGFTDLSLKLDAEDLHELLTRYFQLVDGIIERYGGTVDKHIGDGVMGLFGAPVAHGDDPLRALRAAFEIHDRVETLAAETSQPLSVHIGIASGTVIAGGLGSEGYQEYTVIGDSVNLASRLDGVARSGETVFDREVYQSVAGAVNCEDLGRIAIKGLDRPVQVWRALSLFDADGDTDQRQTKFVGRRREIRQFRNALSYCREDGTGQVIVVRGEAGIGKSRLLAEFMKESKRLDFGTHRALVLDFGAGTGHDAIRTLVRSILNTNRAAGEDISQCVDAAVAEGWIENNQASFLKEYLDLTNSSDTHAGGENLDATAHQAELRRALSNLLTNAARDRAIALFVEDIHWADRAVLRQLAIIAAQVRDSPIMLVMTTRVEGDPTDSAWRNSTSGSQFMTIDLGPLRQADAMELAQDFAKNGDTAAQRCVQRADGNPLFLEQLLRNAAEARDETVPGSIQSLVLARIDRLDPSDKDALQAASVIGQRFSIDAMRCLIGKPDYDLQTLIRHELIRSEGDEYLFTHALIRDSVYGSLLRKRLRNLHLKAAEFFTPTDQVLRAEHLDRAGDPGAPAAYLSAARTQIKSYQYEKALALLDRGLTLATDHGGRYELTIVKAKLLHDAAQVEPSIQAFSDLIDLAETEEQKCRAWLGMAAAMRLADRYKEALAYLDKADGIARDRGDASELAQIHSQRGSLYFALGRTDECAAEHEKSLAYAEQAGSPELEATALSGVADARYVAGRMATALTYFTRSTEVAAAGGFPGIESVNLAMAGFCQFYSAELRKAHDLAQRAIDIATEAGLPRSKMMGDLVAFAVNFEMDDLQAARAHNNEALEISRLLGAPRFEAQSLAFMGRLAWAEGEGETAVKALRDALEMSARVGHGFTGARIMGVLALCMTNPHERRHALENGEKLLAAGAVSHNHLEFYPDAINVSLDLGDWNEARRFAAALKDFTRSEPLALSDFYIARGQALANLGKNPRDPEALKQLRELEKTAALSDIVRSKAAIEAALD